MSAKSPNILSYLTVFIQVLFSFHQIFCTLFKHKFYGDSYITLAARSHSGRSSQFSYEFETLHRMSFILRFLFLPNKISFQHDVFPIFFAYACLVDFLFFSIRFVFVYFGLVKFMNYTLAFYYRSSIRFQLVWVNFLSMNFG